MLHRCTDADCPSYGQRTSARSCACHKTDEHVLTEQRDELLGALGAIWSVRPENWDDDDDPEQADAWRQVQAAVAKFQAA